MEAYCYRSGEILIGNEVPAGVLTIAQDSETNLIAAVSVCGRHAYDGVTFLVPGIPEAETDADALQAYVAFKGRMKKYLQKEKNDAST